MRATTTVWLARRQVGLPGSDSIAQMTVIESIKAIAKMLAEQPLRGSRFEFRVATTQANAEFIKSGLEEFDNVLEAFDFSEKD